MGKIRVNAVEVEPGGKLKRRECKEERERYNLIKQQDKKFIKKRKGS